MPNFGGLSRILTEFTAILNSVGVYNVYYEAPMQVPEKRHLPHAYVIANPIETTPLSMKSYQVNYSLTIVIIFASDSSTATEKYSAWSKLGTTIENNTWLLQNTMLPVVRQGSGLHNALVAEYDKASMLTWTFTCFTEEFHGN